MQPSSGTRWMIDECPLPSPVGCVVGDVIPSLEGRDPCQAMVRGFAPPSSPRAMIHHLQALSLVAEQMPYQVRQPRPRKPSRPPGDPTRTQQIPHVPNARRGSAAGRLGAITSRRRLPCHGGARREAPGCRPPDSSEPAAETCSTGLGCTGGAHRLQMRYAGRAVA